jgi:hypothetical protein
LFSQAGSYSAIDHIFGNIHISVMRLGTAAPSAQHDRVQSAAPPLANASARDGIKSLLPTFWRLPANREVSVG